MVYSVKSLDLLVDGLINAHNLYGNKKAKILSVVGGGERTILDQRGIELELAKRGVFMIRKDFEELIQELRVNEIDRRCFV